jgi:hypothetical protein
MYRAISPDETIFLSMRKARPENSQCCIYMPRVFNIFFRSGRKGTERINMPAINPERKKSLPRFPASRAKPGRKIKGKSFTSTAKENDKPAVGGNRVFNVKTDLFPGSSGAGFLISSKKAKNKNIGPAVSICPEAAVSMTVKGFHAYKTDLHTGSCIFFSILIIMRQVRRSIAIRTAFIPNTLLCSAEPAINTSWAAGG